MPKKRALSRFFSDEQLSAIPQEAIEDVVTPENMIVSWTSARTQNGTTSETVVEHEITSDIMEDQEAVLLRGQVWVQLTTDAAPGTTTTTLDIEGGSTLVTRTGVEVASATDSSVVYNFGVLLSRDDGSGSGMLAVWTAFIDRANVATAYTNAIPLVEHPEISFATPFNIQFNIVSSDAGTAQAYSGFMELVRGRAGIRVIG